MLSRADLDIITRDIRIPGLALMFDIELLSERLGFNLVKQTYLNYKPGTSCTVSVVDAAGTAYAAMAYPRDRFAEVQARKEWLMGPVKAILLNDICVALVPMALDRQIKAASRMGTPALSDGFIRKLLGPVDPGDYLDNVFLRYKPKRRIVARVHSRGRPAALIKCFDPGGFDSAITGSELGCKVSGVARLAVDYRRYTIATAWVNGSCLCPVLSGELHRDAFSSSGRWLADFHDAAPKTQLPFARETRSSLQGALSGIVADFGRLAPGLSSRLYRLADVVNETCSRNTQPLTLIHGDFSADQIILAEDLTAGGDSGEVRPVVIDWDRAMIGNPLRDVGSFLARLEHQSLDGSLEVSIARCAQQTFIDAYLERLPETCLQQLDAFHARALLLLVMDGFRHRHADWLSVAESLLHRVDALMTRPVLMPGSELNAEHTPVLAQALDIDAMRKPMKRLLTCEAEGLVLESAHLLRHKPGRRALIRYEARRVSNTLVSDRVSVLGKLRYRRLDQQTPALHDRLRAQGLHGKNPQGVGVPANLGILPAANIWFQELVPGKELSMFLKAGADTAPFRQAGRALAIFHSTPVRSSRQWTMQSEAAVLATALDKAIRAHPEWQERILALRDDSMQVFESLPTVSSRLVHRDFYQDQLLLDGDRVWILDLDLCAQSDPAIDVGNFLAHIKEFSIRRYGSSMALEPLALAFREGYDSLGSEVDPQRVLVLETLSLARHLHISTLFEDRRHTAEVLLAYCEEQMAWLLPGGRVAMQAQRDSRTAALE